MTGLDFLQQYRSIVSQIRAIEQSRNEELPAGQKRPPMALPDEHKGIAALNTVRDILFKLQHPAAKPPTAADRQRIDVNKLQNETAVRLSDHVRLGIVSYDDFQFPSEDLPTQERIRGLNGINARLQRAWELHHMSPENRAKLAMIEIETLNGELREIRASLTDALARIGGLEQERASEALRD
jgi:hypothetical protein